MSQAGPLVLNVPIGAGINQINDQDGDAVTPQFGIVNIVGAGNITTASDGANTLTISSTGLATRFITDAGNAAPVGGDLYVTGTANQITTSAPIHMLNNDQVVIGLPDDVTINNDLTVNNNITCNNNLLVLGNIGAQDIFAAGSITSTDFIVSLNGIVNTGDITSTGNIESTGTLKLTDPTLPCGVIQVRNDDTVYSSTGDIAGKILISRTLTTDNPVWALPTCIDNTIAITPGDGTLQLSSGNSVATIFRDKAGTGTTAVAKVLVLTGDANIVTTATAGTITTSLSPNINVSGSMTAATVTSNGLMTASNTLNVTTGNLTVLNGAIAASGSITSNLATGGFISNADANENGFFTADADYRSTHGHIFLDNGNLQVTLGSIRGANIIATTDLTLPNTTAKPRVLLQNNASPGLIVPTTSTNGQVVMASTANGVGFGTIIAGTGISVAYTEPVGVRTLTITNTGVGGVKAAFFARLGTTLTNISGDGTVYDFEPGDFVENYDVTNTFNPSSNPPKFTCAVDGIYQFTFVAMPIAGADLTYYTHEISIVHPVRSYSTKSTPIQSRFMPDAKADSLIITATFQLVATQIVYFTFKSTAGTGIKNCSLSPYSTYVLGYQFQ